MRALRPAQANPLCAVNTLLQGARHGRKTNFYDNYFIQSNVFPHSSGLIAAKYILRASAIEYTLKNLYYYQCKDRQE